MHSLRAPDLSPLQATPGETGAFAQTQNTDADSPWDGILPHIHPRFPVEFHAWDEELVFPSHCAACFEGVRHFASQFPSWPMSVMIDPTPSFSRFAIQHRSL